MPPLSNSRRGSVSANRSRSFCSRNIPLLVIAAVFGFGFGLNAAWNGSPLQPIKAIQQTVASSASSIQEPAVVESPVSLEGVVADNEGSRDGARMLGARSVGEEEEEPPVEEPAKPEVPFSNVAPPGSPPYEPKFGKQPASPACKFIELKEAGEFVKLQQQKKHIAALFCNSKQKYEGFTCLNYAKNFTMAMANFTGASLVFIYVDLSNPKLKPLDQLLNGSSIPAVAFFPANRPEENAIFVNTYKCADKSKNECKLDVREVRRDASVLGYVGYHEMAIAEWFAWRLSNEHLMAYKDRHLGKRCVIVGNGPSLNKMNLTFLNNEVNFAVNKIYLGLKRFGFMPTYYNVQNKIVLEQIQDILFGELPDTPKFLNLVGWPMYKLNADDHNLLYLKTDIRKPVEPCTDPRRFCSEGATVTVGNMNLAYWMGCQHVILIGVDHNFIQAKGLENAEEVSQVDDVNHFDPNYFGKGTKWNLADLKTSELSYRYLWRELYHKNGRLITDATVGGKCNLFPKADYRDLFLGDQQKPEQSDETEKKKRTV
eukprot:TRINITY_DN758_c1_g1_i1.p2 TRINITY_DN758_c1_g1~~TRINITY_DN758_c1_g1_i1.p2  ORF type:complete len:541 (-),score=245.72 TRINITY_DN758_c1_g1_i1:497-2119(-)